MATNKRNRPDKDGRFKAEFERNKRKIFATQSICAICGQPVDFSLKYPHPMSATVDHIIAVKNHGHPSDIRNLQLAHLRCNQLKGTKDGTFRCKPDGSYDVRPEDAPAETVSNDNLPWSTNWLNYRADENDKNSKPKLSDQETYDVCKAYGSESKLNGIKDGSFDIRNVRKS